MVFVEDISAFVKITAVDAWQQFNRILAQHAIPWGRKSAYMEVCETMQREKRIVNYITNQRARFHREILTEGINEHLLR